jgi:hypothetical protein
MFSAKYSKGFFIGMFMIISLLFVIVCEDNPASSKKKPQAEATRTVDNEGGVLETDDVALTVPSGAFSEPAELAVYMDETDDFSGNEVTQSIVIQGLPVTFTKPLKLALKYSGELSNESFIAMGIKNPFSLVDDSTIVYSMLPAEDSSGFLICEIPPQDYGEIGLSKGIHFGRDTPAGIFRFRGVSNYQPNNELGKFTIYCPSDMESYVPEIKQMLESCYKTIAEELGFSWDWYDFLWPVQVNVIASEDMANRFLHANSIFGGELTFNDDTYYLININKSSLLNGQMNSIKQDVGKELVLSVLQLYSGSILKIYKDLDYYWVAHAIYYWSEEFFTDPASFTAPRRFVHNEMMPFIGLCAGARHNYYTVQRHGRGMSAVIKYLSDGSSYGIKGPAKTFEMIRSGTPPPSALIYTTDRMLAEWWPGFFHDYVAGDVYHVDGSFFLGDEIISRTWTIDDEQDTEHIFSSSDLGGYDDLSAKQFLVNLNYSEFDNADNLLIDAESTGANDDGVAVIVFGVKNDDLHFLGESINGDAAVELEDLKDYYDNNWRQFLIVVVNSLGEPPFDGKSHIDLKLEVKQSSPPVFTSCKIRLKCHRFYIREYQSGQTDYYDTDNSLENATYHEGSFTGNTFTSNYEYKNNPHTYTREGTIVVVLNETYDNVVSFTMNDVKTYVSNEDAKETISISAENIPLDPDYYGATAFILKGASVQGHITHFSHDKDWGSWGERVIDYESNENSGIYVFFRE